MKHTKLPWKYQAEYNEIIHKGCHFWIAKVQEIDIPKEFEAENQANAEFIVRACNSHYELLESLKDIFSLIESQVLVRNISEDHRPDFHIKAIALVTKLNKAKQAIAKAEGKE